MGHFFEHSNQYQPKKKSNKLAAVFVYALIALGVVALIVYIVGFSGLFKAEEAAPGTEISYGGARDTTGYKAIEKDEAISLIKGCKLIGFYYTAQTTYDNNGKGELSPTGIELTSDASRPLAISIADRYIQELVPIAREAQKTCQDLQFWHDGRYEEKQADGSWQ